MAETLHRVLGSAQPESPFPLTEADERDLAELKNFTKGDDHAFLGLYSRYEAPLLAYCRKMCNNDHRIAEDTFQETWIRIFELRKKPVEIGRFRSVLFRTARNICLNRMRKEYVRHRDSVRDGEESPLALVSSVEPEVEQEELRALIQWALGKLPIAEREVFVLHEYSGYNYSEISNILGRSDSSVKTLAFRARVRLRKLVSGWLGLQDTHEKDEFGINFLFAKE